MSESGNSLLYTAKEVETTLEIPFKDDYQSIQFRIWATKILREFVLKGFVLDDERLKQGTTVLGKAYFDELLERIQEIRLSKRRFYQKITDIYALSVDYDREGPTTKEFFATVYKSEDGPLSMCTSILRL